MASFDQRSIGRRPTEKSVCISDRTAAEDELRKLGAEYRARLLRATIRKDRPGKRSTHILRNFTRDTTTISLL